MPGPRLIVTSKGTFRGLKSLAAFVGAKPENIKRLVRAGRVEELISGSSLFRGYDTRNMRVADLRNARSTITHRLRTYANIEKAVHAHSGARLLTTEADYVYASASGHHRVVRVDCGTPGHPVWRASVGVVMRGGWCGHCRSSVRKVPENVTALLAERGLEALSEYTNALTPMKLRCPDGHVFWSAPSKIWNSGGWCKQCRGSKEEAVVRYYCEAALGFTFELVRTSAGTGRSRSRIPEQADHRFRSKAITDSGASRSLNA